MSGIVPIYQRITSYYISRILNQEFQPEQSIDSINKIMLRHQVSRKTAKLVLRNPVYQIRKGEFTKLSVDKIPIHLFTKHTEEKFTNHEIKIEKDDIYYMFSDGYAAQLGGTKGKKFMHKNLQELILSIQHLTMSEQKEIFNNSIEEWKNASEEEQTDDILILGFKIS